MCLYPKKIKNKKYLPNEKNGGNVPFPPVIEDEIVGWNYDTRVLEINAPCGQCIECRKQKARQWQIRLTEELKEWQYCYFMTFTFAPTKLQEICHKVGYNSSNLVAEYAVRHMLERWRKAHKKSLKHWFITELGHEGTERMHIHGIIFNNEPLEFGEPDENNFREWKYWKYGFVFVGDYCTERTVNYIVKYVTKIDEDHKDYKPLMMPSPGIGRGWLERNKYHLQEYKYRPRNTIDYYILGNGSKVKLPTYYKNKLHGDEEREVIWREFMDKEQQLIAGRLLSNNTDPDIIENILEKGREKNKEFGYGDRSKEWRKRDYNVDRRWLQQVEREKQKQLMLEKLAQAQGESAADADVMSPTGRTE